MSAISAVIGKLETLPLPDPMVRAAIGLLIARKQRRLAETSLTNIAFARAMADLPIIESREVARSRHDELPLRFFELVLGPRRRFGCCHYPTGRETLAEAELRALQDTFAHAGLVNGQRILDLGCGWGSMSLFVATRLPGSQILAVCETEPQRQTIEASARLLELDNLKVVTADLNDFTVGRRFDRVIAIETFEHTANWRALLERIRYWLEPDGRLFVQVTSHSRHSYRFERGNPTDWVAQHFLAGGIMPSHGLIRQFGDIFTVEDEWRWSGRNYTRTARHWLRRFDDNQPEIDAILRDVYGAQAELWRRRWRLFLMSIAVIFARDRGRQWGISQFRLAPIA